ncbi:hypothetical protein LOK49_LG07G01183, partial [Camellia lanceoleosa]
HVTIDFVVGLPQTPQDMDSIWVVVDRLTNLTRTHHDFRSVCTSLLFIVQELHGTRSLELGNIEGSNNQDLSVNVGTSASSHNVLCGNAISAMDVDVTVNIPFALVDEIAEASPAAEDGLQLGDQIVKFGNMESGDDLLPKLASEALSNQDREIPVVVLRQDVISESYDHLHGALMNSDASVRPARRQCPSRCVLNIHSLFASP